MTWKNLTPRQNTLPDYHYSNLKIKVNVKRDL